jgi:signal transduction histidine kinase
MWRQFKKLIVVAAVASLIAPALATERGTADEAEAMVKKAVSYAKANGKDKLISEVNGGKGQFIDRDLYVSVWTTKAVVLAHGANTKLVGKDIIELKDADGKFFMKEIVDKSASAGKGWVDYKWVNPVTKEIQAKSAYFEKVDDIIVSTGFYKK